MVVMVMLMVVGGGVGYLSTIIGGLHWGLPAHTHTHVTHTRHTHTNTHAHIHTYTHTLRKRKNTKTKRNIKHTKTTLGVSGVGNIGISAS